MRLSSTIRSCRDHREGLTLIEAILYTFIFLSTVTILTMLIIDFSSMKNRSKVERETYQEARYLLERINNKVRLAPGIDTGNSIFDDPDGRLVLKTAKAEENPTIFSLVDGDLYEKIGSADAQVLNSPLVIVDELLLRNIVASVTKSSIEVRVSVSYDDRGRKDYQSTSALVSQASLRSNFPYTWTQTDWTGGTGQDIWLDPTQYQSDGAIDHATCPGDVRLGTDLDEVVLHLADSCDLHGDFHLMSDATAADGSHVNDLPDLGLRVGGHFGNEAESDPTHYVDMSFNARANTEYHIWARLRVVTTGDSGTSDSFYIQLDDALDGPAGDPINRIGTNQGLVVSNGSTSWGWDDIWTGIPNDGERFYLESDGSHTVRVQRREDGFAVDQIVLSSSTYLNSAPGSSTIVEKRYTPTATLTSSAYDTGNASVYGQLSWTALTPTNTTLRLRIRSAPTFAELASSEWYGPTSSSDYYDVSDQGTNAIHDGDQWVQYRVYFDTSDVRITPALNAVTLSYSN